jgi:hypothetical protein
MALLVLLGIIAGLAARGAWAFFAERTKDNGPSNPTSTTTADRLAALLEGEDDPGTTIEEKLEALALGLKNVRHRQSMLDGRLNKIDPPAEKGKGNGAAPAAERPMSRADVYRRWKERQHAG